MKLIANNFRIPALLLAALSAAAHEQLLLVVAADMNRSEALLRRCELRHGQWKTVGKPVPVILGRNGLGWGLGVTPLPHAANDPVKHEGDGRAPAGIFELGPVFGYAPAFATAMPYLRATADLICVDDPASADYNRLVRIGPETSVRSFEWMRRKDGLYRFGAFVRHNDARRSGSGSCIFLHIRRAPNAPTAGCTAMKAGDLEKVLHWLDPAKDPVLVQIPQKSLPDAEKRLGPLP